MNQDAKNTDIKNTIRNTKERHSQMNCRVFEVKIVASKLNKKQKEQINQYFREAKWRRNSIIADFDNADRDGNSAIVKVGENFVERSLYILGSQVRQDIYDTVKSEIKGLHTKKAKGETAGALKFKSVCNSIPLRQYGTTYRIDFDHKHIKVQNIKKPFYVRGLKQIPQDSEITNAKLVRKPSGLYFHITCFVPKEDIVLTGRKEGIDFGIEHSLTYTDGSFCDVRVSESKAVKLASKRLNRALKQNGNNKKGRNHLKRKALLQRAYEKNGNWRKDIADKEIHRLLTNNDFIAIQDEMIHNWHSGLFGKQVQHSAMGYIKAKLKTSFKVYVVERSFPSTQICPLCGCLTKHPLSKRDYDCSNCGYHHPSRDTKSAQSILDEALRQVSMERRAQSPAEIGSSMPASLDAMHKNLSMNQEAQVF